ncbi:hypothetical protein [Desulfosporosinus sp.]|uniref:ATP-dependent DNA ligase n=1 Tax=Desulfosporosinus sp. TaxID=157907 RepID=UPI00231ACA4C|nr:hypothetical protein [Desulfosporosinus sp.]MDA8221109.1 hypothetical protein [Desulfitobacterium hafniense]
MVKPIGKSNNVKEAQFEGGLDINEQKDILEFPVKVMEPKRVEVMPSGEFIYQVKWDGKRWITYKSKQETLFQTKAQKIFKSRFAELDHCFDWLPEGSMLDGEVVVLRDGLPHFTSILRRIHSLSLKQSELEVNYVILDVLAWEGEDWRSQTFI